MHKHAEWSWRCGGCQPPASLSPHRFCLPLVLASFPTMATGEEIPPALQDSWGDFWLFRFFVNAAGYASIVVPGYLLIQYFKRRNYLETGKGRSFSSTSCLPLSFPHPFGQSHSTLTGRFLSLLCQTRPELLTELHPSWLGATLKQISPRHLHQKMQRLVRREASPRKLVWLVVPRLWLILPLCSLTPFRPRHLLPCHQIVRVRL